MLMRLLYLLVGIGLLVWIGSSVDLSAVGEQLRQIAPSLALAIVAAYFLAFLIDTMSWQLTLPSIDMKSRWLWRLWSVRMVGEALNSALPMASLGGEPAKVLMLKRRYDIGLSEATASLVMARTINLIGLILFLIVALALAMGDDRLPQNAKTASAIGLAALLTGVAGFFVVQSRGVSSWLLGFFRNGRLAERVAGLIGHIRELESRFTAFYARTPGRFALAVLLALINWVVGTVELWLTMWAVGVPVSFSDAVIIEGVTQLVRTGAFFIPLSLGAQEGAIVLIAGSLSGSPSAGLAAALVRRARELLWIVWGLWLGRDLLVRKTAD